MTTATDPWPLIKQDRLTLASYLEGLNDAEWDKPSLCEDWTVKNVASHLLVPPTVPKSKVFLKFAGSGFDLNKMSAKFVAEFDAKLSNQQLAHTIRSSAGSRTYPPGLNPRGVFNEVVIHSLDIAEAVGKPIDIPLDHYVLALDGSKTQKSFLGNVARVAGLTLKATDADWHHGAGPLVEGKAKDLLLAMTGRQAALDALSGDGVAILRTR